MQMLRSLINRYRAVSQPTNELTKIIAARTPDGLSHNSNISRWHTDCRSPVHVVLLHGLYSSGNVFWNDFMRAVNDFPTVGKTPKFPTHLYALDLRSHGRSQHGDRPFDLVQACVDVAGFIQNPVYSSNKFYLIGYGIGGYIASMVALAHPSLCEGLATLNSSILTINPKISPVTTISLGERNAEGILRSDIKGASESTRTSNCIEFLHAINSNEKDKILEEIFLDTHDSKSFLSSAFSLNTQTQKRQWKCNIADISRFDIEREKNPLDIAIGESKSINSSIRYLRIMDKFHTPESHDSIREIFPEVKSVAWDNFGGRNAESMMSLRRPAEVAQIIFEHFNLVENED